MSYVAALKKKPEALRRRSMSKKRWVTMQLENERNSHNVAKFGDLEEKEKRNKNGQEKR